MMFHRDGDRLLVIASNAGAALDPQWYLNLKADSRVFVEVEDEHYEAEARPLDGPDYHQAWSAITAAYPFFVDHQAAVRRRIPVVELIRQ